MADDTATTTEDTSITFNVRASNDAKFTLTLPLSTSVADLKAFLATSEYADTPVDRQRLIYSGRVLKDNETLSTYKIKDGHTIHLVKSAASNQRQNPAAQSSSATSGPTPNQSIPGVPTNIAAGTGNNPLAGLTGARYAGFAQLPGAGMFGPDGGMGPPPDADAMLNMLENPQVQATMNEALQNPAVIDMMIQQNPMLRDMGPGVRQMMQSPEFRRMLTDPNAIRQMTQLQRAMGGLGGGLGGFGLGGGAGNDGFPAPGVTNTTPEENRGQQQQDSNQNTTAASPPPVNPFLAPGLAGNPFANLFGTNPAGAAANAPSGSPSTSGEQNNNAGQGATPNPQNPFSLLLNNPGVFGFPSTQPGASGGNAGSQPEGGQGAFNPQSNPFLRDPALFQNFMQAMGGQQPGGTGEAARNPFTGLFGSPPAQDNRPPEERYAEQLRQLNDMGFYEFERNIEALRRTGGSVQGAVEYLLNHPS